MTKLELVRGAGVGSTITTSDVKPLSELKESSARSIVKRRVLASSRDLADAC